MNRSTRSAAKQQHTPKKNEKCEKSEKSEKNEVEEDVLMEDGFSVVDTDQKKAKNEGAAASAAGAEPQQAKGAKAASATREGAGKAAAAATAATAATATTGDQQPGKPKSMSTPTRVKTEEQTNGSEEGNDVPMEVVKVEVDDDDEPAMAEDDQTAEEESEKGTGEEVADGEDGEEVADGEDGDKKPEEGGSTENGDDKEQEEKEKMKVEEAGKQAKPSERRPKHPIVWVSNISRHVKATDLKKHFSKHGKVVTAKIVTNGRSFFGYVCLDTLDAVDVCVKNLDNSEFNGRRISVTVDKPVKDDRIVRRKPDPGEGAASHRGGDPLTTVYDDGASEGRRSGTGGTGEEHQRRGGGPDSTTGGSGRRRGADTSQMSEEDLRREVAMCEREIHRLRTRLMEEQERRRAEVTRARRLERELEDADGKIREDRKRYERDREEWAKKNRLEQLRLDADRVIMEREKEEMRRAREDFERDLRRFIEDQHQAAMDRPSLRASSPPPAKRFRAGGPGDADGPDMGGKGGGAWMGGADMTDKPGAFFRESGGGGGGGQTRGGGGPYFSGGGAAVGGWQTGQGGQGGGSQWRSMGGGGGGGGQPSYFKNDTYRPGGGAGTFVPGESGPGTFRGAPFERKF